MAHIETTPFHVEHADDMLDLHQLVNLQQLSGEVSDPHHAPAPAIPPPPPEWDMDNRATSALTDFDDDPSKEEDPDALGSFSLRGLIQGVCEYKDTYKAFRRSYKGLPKSCRNFFKATVVCTVLFLFNALLVLFGIPTLPQSDEMATARDTQTQMLLYYGMSQIVFALRGLMFCVNSLRQENKVEIDAATMLLFMLLFFDFSAGFVTSFFLGGSLLDASTSGYVQNFVLGIGFRTFFFFLLLCSWLGMVYWGSVARVDFGWRIFKLCGTDLELKLMYEALWKLRAWYKLDVVLCVQQYASACVKPLSRVHIPPLKLTRVIFCFPCALSSQVHLCDNLAHPALRTRARGRRDRPWSIRRVSMAPIRVGRDLGAAP